MLTPRCGLRRRSLRPALLQRTAIAQLAANAHAYRREAEASQRSLHNAPIFRLLLKVAVKGTHQCDFFNFCGAHGPNKSISGARLSPTGVFMPMLVFMRRRGGVTTRPCAHVCARLFASVVDALRRCVALCACERVCVRVCVRVRVRVFVCAWVWAVCVRVRARARGRVWSTAPLSVHVVADCVRPRVGSSSQADYLKRNVAMDDSIGGS